MLENKRNISDKHNLNNSFVALLDSLRMVLSVCDNTAETDAILRIGDITAPMMDIAQLMTEAQRQALTGLVAEYMAKHDTRMAHAEKMRCVTMVLQVEKKNRWMNDHVAALAALFDGEGIRYAVMKGQTVARFYTNPLLRVSGDIDVYVAERDFGRACSLMERQGYAMTDYTMLHATYSKKGCPEVEIHFAVQKLQWLPHYRCLQRITRQMVDNAKAKYIDIDGLQVAILPAELEVLLYTIHAFNHVLNGGLGLRQVVDWMLCVRTIYDEIDIEKLEKLLAGTGMTAMFRVLGYICSEYLGMSLNTTLWIGTGLHYSDKDVKTGNELIKWIGVAGNFGHSLNQSRPQFYIRFLKNCWRFRRLGYKEVFIYPFMKIKRGMMGENHLRNHL